MNKHKHVFKTLDSSFFHRQFFICNLGINIFAHTFRNVSRRLHSYFSKSSRCLMMSFITIFMTLFHLSVLQCHSSSVSLHQFYLSHWICLNCLMTVCLKFLTPVESTEGFSVSRHKTSANSRVAILSASSCLTHSVLTRCLYYTVTKHDKGVSDLTALQAWLVYDMIRNVSRAWTVVWPGCHSEAQISPGGAARKEAAYVYARRTQFCG